MHIDCPGCGKSYHIRTAELGANGRRVACPRCDAIWFVGADGRQPAAEPAVSGPQAGEALTEITLPATAIVPPASRPAPPHRRERRIPAILAACALVVASMALIGLRSTMVRAFPRSATAYAALGLPVNLRGLALENFRAVALDDGSRTVLGIEGEIKNLRGRMTNVPALHLAIRGADGRILYSWVVAAQKPRLAANETAGFRARLAAPPRAGTAVLVDFVPEPESRLATFWRKVWRL